MSKTPWASAVFVASLFILMCAILGTVDTIGNDVLVLALFWIVGTVASVISITRGQS